MSRSRVKSHVCNALCDGDEHSDVVWAEYDTPLMRFEIEAVWNEHPISEVCVLLDVRLVEGGRPKPEDFTVRRQHGKPFAQWEHCYAWGVRWRELPVDADEVAA